MRLIFPPNLKPQLESLQRILTKTLEECQEFQEQNWKLEQECQRLNSNHLEAMRDYQEATSAQLRAEARMQHAEAMRDAAAEEMRQQVELNSELLNQGFTVETLPAQHSALVDPEKFQVLTQVITQFTVRKLDLRAGLMNALLSPFAFNVARHLVRKLTEGGHIREGKTAKVVNVDVMIEGRKLALEDKAGAMIVRNPNPPNPYRR